MKFDVTDIVLGLVVLIMAVAFFLGKASIVELITMIGIFTAKQVPSQIFPPKQ